MALVGTTWLCFRSSIRWQDRGGFVEVRYCAVTDRTPLSVPGFQPDRLLGAALRMTNEKTKKNKAMKDIGMERNERRRQPSPDWASGLRRLYDSVVEEPLPDSFSKLLEDLDSADG